MSNLLNSLDNLSTASLVAARGTSGGVTTPEFAVPSDPSHQLTLSAMTKFSITNEMVAAFGAAQTGVIPLVTLPPRTQIGSFLVLYETTAAGLTTATFGVGRTAPDYFDMFAGFAQDLLDTAGKTLSGTVGGSGIPKVPSLTVPTALFVRFDATTGAEVLGDITDLNLSMYLTAVVLP